MAVGLCEHCLGVKIVRLRDADCRVFPKGINGDTWLPHCVRKDGVPGLMSFKELITVDDPRVRHIGDRWVDAAKPGCALYLSNGYLCWDHPVGLFGDGLQVIAQKPIALPYNTKPLMSLANVGTPPSPPPRY